MSNAKRSTTTLEVWAACVVLASISFLPAPEATERPEFVKITSPVEVKNATPMESTAPLVEESKEPISSDRIVFSEETSKMLEETEKTLDNTLELLESMEPTATASIKPFADYQTALNEAEQSGSRLLVILIDDTSEDWLSTTLADKETIKLLEGWLVCVDQASRWSVEGEAPLEAITVIADPHKDMTPIYIGNGSGSLARFLSQPPKGR